MNIALGLVVYAVPLLMGAAAARLLFKVVRGR